MAKAVENGSTTVGTYVHVAVLNSGGDKQMSARLREREDAGLQRVGSPPKDRHRQ